MLKAIPVARPRGAPTEELDWLIRKRPLKGFFNSPTTVMPMIPMEITIRRADASDTDGIWQIFHEVVERGDTYTYDPEISREHALALWFAPGNKTFVALVEDEIVGTYIIKPNHPGQGSHVANAGYMVRSDMQGKGIGRAMCEHSLESARQAGFQAMQFNIVVSTNTGAVQLWQSMGFKIVGTLPKVFRHKQLGLVDAYVMHRFIDPL